MLSLNTYLDLETKMSHRPEVLPVLHNGLRERLSKSLCGWDGMLDLL